MNYNSMNHQTKPGHSLKKRIASDSLLTKSKRLINHELPHIKSRCSSLLILPLLLMLLSGSANFYLHSKYMALVPVDEARYTKLQQTLQAAHYNPATEKTVIAIAREAVEDDQRTARILFHVGFIFIYISIVYLIVVWKYLPKAERS